MVESAKGARMSRWGLTIPLTGMPLPEQRDIVAELPDLGYTDVWSAESNGPDAITALRPGMLRLAAREADGAITNWLSAQDVRKVRAELGTGTELIARLFVCPTEDVDEARGLGRWLIAAYMTVPVYAAFHEWL